MIKSLPVLCHRVLLVALLPLGVDVVIVGEGSFSFGCPRSGFGLLDASLTRGPLLILLFAELHVGSVGCFPRVAPVGVVWSWVTMFWSSNVCTLLLLLDARRLFSASSRSLFRSRSLAIESQSFVSGSATSA